MKRARGLLLFGGIMLAAGLAAPAFGQEAEPVAKPQRKATKAAALRERTEGARLLQRSVDKVEWTDATFEEVVDWLRDQSDDRVNIIIRWTQLNAEGVDAEKPVTLSLRDTTVGVVLQEVVDQLSEDGQVRFRAVGDTLRISSKADFERKMETRVYNVSDLVIVPPDFGRSAPTIDLEQAARQGGSQGGGGGGQSVFGGGSSGGSEDLEEEEDEIEERLQELRDAIRNSIARDTWGADTGGQGQSTFQATGSGNGRIEIFNNRSFIITNTIEVHEEIAGYFSYDR